MSRYEKGGLLLLGIVLCLGLWLVVWKPWGSSAAGSGGSGSSDGPTPASDDATAGTSVATVRLASRKGDDSGGLLGASMPLPDVPGLLPAGSQASLASDVVDWMTAYGDLDPGRWVALMGTTESDLPAQFSDPKVLKEYWLWSLEAVQHVRFDSAKTTTRLIPLSSLQDVHRESRSNCTTNPVDTPFMRTALTEKQFGVEVVFEGNYVREQSSQSSSVALAITFAWNKKVSKWIVVRTCLLNVPDDFNDEPPLL